MWAVNEVRGTIHSGGILTEDTGHKTERELRTENGQNPGGCVQCGRYLVLIEPFVQVRDVITNETRQLVQLQLELFHVWQVVGAHFAAEHQVLE